MTCIPVVLRSNCAGLAMVGKKFISRPTVLPQVPGKPRETVKRRVNARGLRRAYLLLRIERFKLQPYAEGTPKRADP